MASKKDSGKETAARSKYAMSEAEREQFMTLMEKKIEAADNKKSEFELEKKDIKKKSFRLELPKNGTKQVRIIHPPRHMHATAKADSYPDPFLERHFHYNVPGLGFNGGNGTVLCPKKNGYEDTCPICDWASKLWKKGQEAVDSGNEVQGKAWQKQAKDLFAGQRYCSLFVERGPDGEGTNGEGVKWWGYSKKIRDVLYAKLQNKYTRFWTDLIDGMDVEITHKEKKGSEAFDTVLADVLPARKPILESDEEIDELLSNLPMFEEAWTPMPAAEIFAKLNAAMLGEKDADKASVEVVRGRNAGAVAAAFDEADEFADVE